MKKLIFKSAIMLTVAVGASNYMLYLVTGKSPFDNLSFGVPDISLDEMKPDLTSSVGGDSSTEGKVYKWVDKHGVTQYSAEPPPEHIQAKTLHLDENTNVVQGMKIPEKPKQEPAPKPKVAAPQNPLFNPGQAKKLMEDAQNVENLLKERAEKQEKLMKDI